MSYTYTDVDIVRCLGANTQSIRKTKSVQCHSNRCVSYTYTDTGIDNVRHIICQTHNMHIMLTQTQSDVSVCYVSHRVSGGKYSGNIQKQSPVLQRQVCVIYVH